MNNDKAKMILGMQVRKRRKELCLTKAEIATKIGVSENFLSDIENGKKFPKFDVFINLCDTLNCNANYLISEKQCDSIDERLIQVIESLTAEEQNTFWKLLDCYYQSSR